ncbi:hypothetical protein CANARDRAFT_29749 [[Candida] arabinofermentans NRRL YB-2248]|uniref:Uncharacterized protein n=1 Tax=[Candida] arabinofermentans NRRL YB-2248 TaxID=983967 RepID=A0A1E4SW82_9ASCO|nr:hypothetical protein CANARDRAFT_29749 [[Candida] arabinofermentans NRRL YB-2248]
MLPTAGFRMLVILSTILFSSIVSSLPALDTSNHWSNYNYDYKLGDIFQQQDVIDQPLERDDPDPKYGLSQNLRDLSSSSNFQFDPQHKTEQLINSDASENDNLNVYLSSYYITSYKTNHYGNDDRQTNGEFITTINRYARLELMVKRYSGTTGAHKLTNIVYQELIFNLTSLPTDPILKSFDSTQHLDSNVLVELEPFSVVNKVYDYKDNKLINVRFLDTDLVTFSFKTTVVDDSSSHRDNTQLKVKAIVSYQNSEIILTNFIGSRDGTVLDFYDDNTGNMTKSRKWIFSFSWGIDDWNSFIDNHETTIIMCLSIIILVLVVCISYIFVFAFNSRSKRSRREFKEKRDKREFGHKINSFINPQTTTGASNLSEDEKERLIKMFFGQKS